MRTLLWLDDIRNPFSKLWSDYLENECKVNLNEVDIHWVKNFYEFYTWIEKYGVPNIVCFDHDLGDTGADEKTGYHCAIYLVDYCEESKLDIPEYHIQSSNPVGREKIDSLMRSYHKFYLSELQ